MSGIPLTIPRGDPTQEGAAESAPAESDRAPATIRFLDQEGRPLGRPRRPLIPPPLLMEAPGSDGAIRNVSVDPPLVLRASPPTEAVAIELLEPGRAPSLVPLARARRASPSKPLSRTMIGSAHANVTLAVMAERFDDEAMFLEQCRFLHQRIVATPPFSQAPEGVGIIALFWRTDPARGQLKVPQPTQQPDLIYGDRELARKFLKKANVRCDRAMVLVNFPRRGGAGGDGTFPAWVTNTSSATDTWEQVALHELGHAFGLGDEYQSVGPSGIGAELEPNICNTADPLAAPWKALVTASAPPRPTAATDRGADLPSGLVGTFEGARYKPQGLYRPSFRCLMRNTQDLFCPVCQAHILARLRA